MTRYESSEDFFHAFEMLVRKIDNSGQRTAANRLSKGFSCLNGLTDGWALLLDSIEKTVSQDQGKIQPEDMIELKGMLKVVREAVYRT